ncbi:hypothetical protein CBOM_00478 [Ceraceosorus bombacis]|uniref:Uncharacterized protein n=1 Tax=Ceraceosorus bombacis TaxID=401625 RepID=A0A0P1BA71_9BASI|nr:hypothetical protein CBOM_00478 [Ceraceosorus bombacis]
MDPGYPDASAALKAVAQNHNNVQDLDAKANNAASLREEANINDGKIRTSVTKAALRQVQIARMEHFERLWSAADRECTLISFMLDYGFCPLGTFGPKHTPTGIFKSQHSTWGRASQGPLCHLMTYHKNILVAICTGQAGNPGVFQSPLLPGWQQHLKFPEAHALGLIFKANSVQKVEWNALVLEQMSKSFSLVYDLLKAGQMNLAKCQDLTWASEHTYNKRARKAKSFTYGQMDVLPTLHDIGFLEAERQPNTAQRQCAQMPMSMVTHLADSSGRWVVCAVDEILKDEEVKDEEKDELPSKSVGYNNKPMVGL